jgi:hypothetical protein
MGKEYGHDYPSDYSGWHHAEPEGTPMRDFEPEEIERMRAEDEQRRLAQGYSPKEHPYDEGIFEQMDEIGIPEEAQDWVIGQINHWFSKYTGLKMLIEDNNVDYNRIAEQAKRVFRS